MPYLNLRTTVALTDDLAARLATVLTDLTVEVLGKKRELTAVVVEGMPTDRWFLGGSALKVQHMQTFMLDIKVTAGTNTKDERALYINRVWLAMSRLLGELHPASYIVIHELPGDAWGYQGRTQEFRYISARPI